MNVPGVPFLGTPGMIWAFFVPGVPVLGTPGTVRGQRERNSGPARRRESQVYGRIGGKGEAGPGEGGGAHEVAVREDATAYFRTAASGAGRRVFDDC